MLIRFSTKNFRSFGETPFTLNLVSSSKIKQPPGHVCAASTSLKVLRNAVIYGANAAGKSNLIKAFKFFVRTVRKGKLPAGISKEFCRTDSQNQNRESIFDIQIEIDGRCFDYGFSCIMKERSIASEWLYELKGDENTLLFSRDKDNGIRLCSDVTGKAIERFNIYKEDFLDAEGLSSPSTFLSYLNDGKSYDKNSPLGYFRLIYQWFKNNIKIIGAGQINPNWEFYYNSRLDEVAALLASFDTGIAQIKERTMTFDEMTTKVPEDVMEKLKQILAEKRNTGKERQRGGLIVRSNDAFFGIDEDSNGEPRVTTMEIHHENSPFSYDYGDESDGTRRLFDFVDMLLGPGKDILYVVDELNLSLHPLLTRHFIELFNEVHANDDCQLIFTTHENDIMSYKYFRRDEIWFVDRNEKGESILYSLDEFANPQERDSVRSDARIGKKYMEGRYRGIPVLSKEVSLATLEE